MERQQLHRPSIGRGRTGRRACSTIIPRTAPGNGTSLQPALASAVCAVCHRPGAAPPAGEKHDQDRLGRDRRPAARRLLAGGGGRPPLRPSGEDIDGPRGRSAWKVGRGRPGPLHRARRLADRHLPAGLPPAAPRGRRAPGQPASFAAHATRGPAREAVWDPEAVAPGKPQPFRLAYSFRCVLGLRRPTPAMTEATRRLDARPRQRRIPGPQRGSRATPSRSDARPRSWPGRRHGGPPTSCARLFDYVRDLPDEPALGPLGAAGLPASRRRRRGGKSRLLVALCRNRGIPARLVTGLILSADREHAAAPLGRGLGRPLAARGPRHRPLRRPPDPGQLPRPAPRRRGRRPGPRRVGPVRASPSSQLRPLLRRRAAVGREGVLDAPVAVQPAARPSSSWSSSCCCCRWRP